MERKTWNEFVDGTGLLWWVNRTLHLFGWAIVIMRDTETKEIVECFPARVKHRGFSLHDETNGFNELMAYIKKGE